MSLLCARQSLSLAHPHTKPEFDMKFYTNVDRIGEQIVMRYVDDGDRKLIKTKFQPTLYVQGNGEYRDIHNRQYYPTKFDSIKAATDFIHLHDGVENFVVAGNTKYQYEFINTTFPEEIQFDVDLLNICYVDIEVWGDGTFPEPADAKFPINAISLRIHGKTYAFGLRHNGSTFSKDGVDVFLFDTEIELMNSFVQFWTECQIDIISGWNVDFDITYICKRLENISDKSTLNKLSPYKSVYSYNRDDDYGKSQLYYTIKGISKIDYLEIYKKFIFKTRESYRLDYIATIELDEQKTDVSDYDNLFDLYEKNFELFMTYNIQDVELVERLDKKLKFMEIAVNLAYFSKVNFEDVTSPMRYWENIIQNYFTENKMVIPIKRENSVKNSKFKGAYVKPPIVGRYNNIVSFDFASLYPSIMIAFNISPECIEDQIEMRVDDVLNRTIDLTEQHNKNQTVAVNGVCFSKNKDGFIPTLVGKMLRLRKEYKNKMLDVKREIETLDKFKHQDEIKQLKKQSVEFFNKQMVAKVAANSFFGICGLVHFRFYDIRLAEAITLSAQAANKNVELQLNHYINQTFSFPSNTDHVVYMDTDSCYISLDQIIDRLTKQVGSHNVELAKKIGYSKLSEKINESITDFEKYLNCKHDLSMKLEAVGKGLFIKRKKYLLSVYHFESVDYQEPELKMTGVEALKSSTPKVCRDALTKCAKFLMQGTEEDLVNFVTDFKEKWKTFSPDEIALPSAVNGLHKYHLGENKYKKGCPIHIRAAIVYNYMLKLHNLDKLYTEIKDGVKVKYVFLYTNNPTGENVIAFPNKLPVEFGLNEYVDMRWQYKRAFIKPLEIMTEHSGWHYEKANNLLDLFA